jgi:imidazolonepropionase-like amidohydrolase
MTYLPFGVTTIRIVGEPEQWIPMTLQWQKKPLATEPDIFTCGAALVSEEPNRKTYISHVVVHDPAGAAKKVQQYYDMGIRDIKLYWRLRYPELISALHKANELGMNVCAHIDRKVTLRDSVVQLGVKDLEHLHPYGMELLTNEALQEVQDSLRKYYPSQKGVFLGWEMEVWTKLGLNNPKMDNSIALLKKHHVSLTPTIHIFGQALGLSYIKGPVTIENGGLNTTDFTPVQLKRCLKGYSIMMSYLRKMYDEGVQLNIGTDCPGAGQAVLSEMLLIHETGIPMKDVLKMATLNNAKAIGRSELYGSVEKGKRADLIIFDTNPLEKPEGLTGKKIVVKDGIEYNHMIK